MVDLYVFNSLIKSALYGKEFKKHICGLKRYRIRFLVGLDKFLSLFFCVAFPAHSITL